VHEIHLASIPAPMLWRNDPVRAAAHGEDELAIVSGAKTDLFVDPSGAAASASSPCAVFTPPDSSFILSARVTVAFASTYDAGVLVILVRDDAWAKLCFEYSPRKEPMVVSVVTRGLSDDCNSTALTGDTVSLRIAHTPSSTAFHYSSDGRYWNLVRYFTLGPTPGLRVGFSSQSPTGDGCRAVFSDIRYAPGTIADIRGGA
jgi:uncharacterized protein